MPLATQPAQRPESVRNTGAPALATPRAVSATGRLRRGRSAAREESPASERTPRERGVPREDASVGFLLTQQGGPPDIVALRGREADRELGQRGREERDLAAFGVDAQLVPVQRQPGFQAQSVPRPQATGNGSCFDEKIPEVERVLAGDEELEPQRFACVARPSQEDVGGAHLDHGQRVAPRLGEGALGEQSRDDLARQRSLQ